MRQLGKAILGINQTDFVVAGVSALACLGTLAGMPVWALFIGWAWYLAIGANKTAIREGSVTCVAAAVLALTAVVLTDAFAVFMPGMQASMLAVFLMIMALMVALKLPCIKHSLVGFNSFSCIFAGYYLGAFPAQSDYILNLVVAFVYITGANILGLFVGWASQQLAGFSFRRRDQQGDLEIS
ncbi:DUF1097 domain-containing protein [Selenomonas sp. KH1T6]|uniref:DUF1097 domain-containing protein n=1 Tax=Selenomonas sp. KH1T6 TaxID=3158784 RepID=UPI0008A7CFA2|nr:Protein of unknown function [Selenomonas ruminantium]